MTLFKKITPLIVWLAFFALPWQTRWIFYRLKVGNQTYEYGQLSLYGSALILVVAVLLILIRRQVEWRRLRWLVPIFAWLLLSLLWSVTPILSLYYVFLFIIAVGYYILVLQSQWELISSALISAGIVQALLAMQQFFQQHITASKWLGLAEHSPEILGQSVIVVNGLRMLRAYGSLPHPNMLAGFLVIVLFLLFFWQNRRQSQSYYERFFVLFIGAIIFGGLVLTFSRAALFALALGIVWIIISALKQKDSYGLRVILSLGIIFLTIITFWSFSLGDILVSRLDSNQRLEIISVEQRLGGFQEAQALLTPKNLTVGSGFGTYVQALATKFPGRNFYDYQPVHSAPVILLIEIGLIGVLLLIMPLRKISIVSANWLQYSLVIPVLVMAIFDHWLVSSYFGLALIFISLALLAKSGDS